MEEVCEGKDYSFPKEEEKILAFWTKVDAFHTQLKKTEGLPEYVFYDGPPFATGLPHYGHILAGTIKDVVTRYQSATGHHVVRRFGWDCHGLPVEYEIDQKFGVKTREDVLKMGIANYNEECRSIVMRYSQEWEKAITRVGRWIDFKDDYKTLDPSFMESVWWVFKQLFEKGYVYRGFKVMPYSTGCKTPLSNFEAGLNYKDADDPAVMVSFPLEGDPDGAGMVAWTTTPWTLPSNLALCVNANFTYTKVRNKDTKDCYIVAEALLSMLPGKKKQQATKATTETGAPANGTPVAVGTAAAGGAKKGHKKGGAGKGHGGGASGAVAGGADANGAAVPSGVDALDTSVYEVLGSFKGADLVGRKYAPLFPYFADLATAFRVVADDYVTDKSGTGVVHCAPAFGEDDYRVCKLAGIVQKGEAIPNPVDADGCFEDVVTDFKGRFVKEADKDIIAAVKAMGRLVQSGSIRHSYPFCWRSDTPLLYKAVPSWFVAVEQFKDKLVACNQQTYWVPDFVKEKRFHNWLEAANDWAISRSRFWGTPLPIWMSEDGEEIQVIGSVEELRELSGFHATDLHRHFIDHVTIPSKRGPDFPPLKRVEEVFDCWFESGSMPYASIHYPFENQELFKDNFPGHFVAEGIDQTRGWFYTLMVLSTALFEKPAFQNLICNGLVLAEDGKKMSKRLKNYPPPQEVVDEHGADALRLYLINSPVVRAETLRFRKEGVYAVVRDVFLPWYNAYRFLVQNVQRLQAEGQPPFCPSAVTDLQLSANVLDRWINSYSESLVRFVRKEMDAYRLYTVVPYLLTFIDRLTNVYVRFNRKRLKGRSSDDDCQLALSTLFHVLLTLCKAMAPFTPFFTEAMYQNLRKVDPGSEESVHYCAFPEPGGETDERIERSVARMMTVIDLGRTIRERHARPIKTPLKNMVVVHPDASFLEDITGTLREYVEEELNVRCITPCANPLEYAVLKAEPDFSVLGKRLGKAMGAVAKKVKEMELPAIQEFEKTGAVEIEGHQLGPGDIKIMRHFTPPAGVDASTLDAAGDGDVLVVLDLQADEGLIDAGTARELVNRVQKLRKKVGLDPSDAVEVYAEELRSAPEPSDGSDQVLQRLLETQAKYLNEALGCPLLPARELPSQAVVIEREVCDGVGGSRVAIILTKATVVVNAEQLLTLCEGDAQQAEGLEVLLRSRDPSRLRSEVTAGGGTVAAQLDGCPKRTLRRGVHFHLSVGESLASQEKPPKSS
eukprot:TRINITY_DN3268_c0_g1_i2.p1 TRINITY_DN3268_c0_g1~~TRINITY_DN3268_c0_g1_i2.p1  ORF type:complete len:1233 (+),score=293.29 TRINITY_DN3268_c0_g1_i2:403-4101(+)